MSPNRRPPPTLPVRQIGDEAIAEAMDPDGCAICRLRARSAARLLDAVLYESVNDIGFRADLSRARGFCRPHAHQVLAASRRQAGSVGAAILLRAIVRDRLDELRAVIRVRAGRRGRHLERVAIPAACPVCAHATAAGSAAMERLLELVDQPAWQAALGTAGLCLDDFLRLWQAAERRRSEAWVAVAEAQLRRFESIERRLAGLVHHSSAGRRHELRDVEATAPDEAARLLGGDPPQR